jgi:aspartate aminotransferase
MTTSTVSTVPTAPPLSRRVDAVAASMRAMIQFQTRSTWSRRRGEPGISDFTFGNPQEFPLPGFVDALQRWATPGDKDWFAYKTSEPEARRVVAESLRGRYALPFEPEDVAMTPGGFTALAVGLQLLTDPGDEVIISLPAWLGYEPMTVQAGAQPVKVPSDPRTFDLDLEAIAAAITPRTRIVVVNTPHNPTGRIYPPETLSGLAEILTEATARNGRTIYILSDEPYARIVFDGRQPCTPAAFYPDTLIAYSYGKVLLTPGQRIGYLAISPQAAARQELRETVGLTQLAGGWLYPNALLQHAIADLEALSIDMAHLQRKRDRMATALRDAGYRVIGPEGTFYLFVESPRADAWAFTEQLAREGIFVLPSEIFGVPGHFRISLTANDEMIERSLPGFRAAYELAHAHQVIDALVDDGW